jgi:hypothetical protein
LGDPTSTNKRLGSSVPTFLPSYAGSRKRRHVVQDSPGINVRLYSKNTESKKR